MPPRQATHRTVLSDVWMSKESEISGMHARLRRAFDQWRPEVTMRLRCDDRCGFWWCNKCDYSATVVWIFAICDGPCFLVWKRPQTERWLGTGYRGMCLGHDGAALKTILKTSEWNFRARFIREVWFCGVCQSKYLSITFLFRWVWNRVRVEQASRQQGVWKKGGCWRNTERIIFVALLVHTDLCTNGGFLSWFSVCSGIQ